MSEISNMQRTYDEHEGESVCASYDSLIDLIVLNSPGYDFEIVDKKGFYKVVSGQKLLSQRLFKATWSEAVDMHCSARITELAEIQVWCYTKQVWVDQDISLILKL